MSISTIFLPLTVMAPTEYGSVEGSDGSDDAVDERRMHGQAEPRVVEGLASRRSGAQGEPRSTPGHDAAWRAHRSGSAREALGLSRELAGA
jgi:hypothetical protein